MKSGFVSIIGKPNVGKSTLLNQVTGVKLAGVSSKPQTTRQVIRGIVNDGAKGQIVFLDTPGYHRPKDSLGKFMVREVKKTFLDADLFYLMVNPQMPEAIDLELLAELRSEIEAGQKETGNRRPAFCVINKVDMVDKLEILPVIERYQKEFSFSEFIPISALRGTQVNLLTGKTFEYLPEHAPYFPSDIASDQTERFIVAELIREKVFQFTGKEIPYASAVEIELFQEEGGLVRIEAVVCVERDSQKAIVIGAKGSKAKEIGTAARLDLETFLGKKVFLKLWVKTLKNWKHDAESLKRLGFG